MTGVRSFNWLFRKIIPYCLASCEENQEMKKHNHELMMELMLGRSLSLSLSLVPGRSTLCPGVGLVFGKTEYLLTQFSTTSNKEVGIRRRVPTLNPQRRMLMSDKTRSPRFVAWWCFETKCWHRRLGGTALTIGQVGWCWEDEWDASISRIM